MNLSTLYSPTNHPEGTAHKTKAEALAHGYVFSDDEGRIANCLG
jgi:hypothetical protein